MRTMSQISLSDLNAADEADFVAALANVVEYSPWIAGQLAAKRPFAGINQLHAALMAAIQSAEPEVQLALIRAHPDLANKTQRAAGLTAESTDEQNSAGLDRLSEAEYAAFERVNNAYRDKFDIPISSACAVTPGIPCCAISRRDCAISPRPRRDVRSRRSAVSRRCGLINSSKPMTSSRSTAGSRPMCWTTTPANPRRAFRSSWSSSRISARAA